MAACPVAPGRSGNVTAEQLVALSPGTWQLLWASHWNPRAGVTVWEHQGGGWARLRSILGNRTAGGGPCVQGEEGRAGGKTVSPGDGLSPQVEKELVSALRSCQVK